MVIDIREKMKNISYVKAINGEKGCCGYCCWVRYVGCVLGGGKSLWWLVLW
jgi:hypothetical protein